DMISILILTPFLLTWSKWPHGKVPVKIFAEIGLLTLFVLVVGLIVFLGLFRTDHRVYPVTYLVFPPLIWASLRFGPRGALSAIFALSILAVLGTIRAYPLSLQADSVIILYYYRVLWAYWLSPR